MLRRLRARLGSLRFRHRRKPVQLPVAVSVRNASGLAASAESVIEVMSVPAGALLITLAFADGVTLAFSQDQATDLGDYVGSFVRQRCLMQRQGPWVVFFRPDADGQRAEAVVEYGSFYNFTAKPPLTESGVAPAHILSPYTATITQSGATLATVQVPRHYWGARWRWQSAPRPFVRTFADFVAMKALLPMSNAAMWGKRPALRSIAHAGPMTPAGLQTGMGTPGDRPELGPTTEYQAGWLVAGDENGRASMMAQAEAAGSMCIHIRSADGFAPLDVQKFPYLSQIFGSGTGKIPTAPRLTYAQDPNYFNTQCAHYPDVAFVPWLLTDDPYLLEECQFNAVYHATESNYHQATQKLPGMAQPSETRGWAWGMRDISRMAAFAPETVPSWLLPRSAFRANLNDCLTYAKKYLASTTPACSVFSLITQGNYLSSWMMGYHAAIAGWMKWSRLFPEWDAACSYIMKSVLAFNAPPEAGGWDRRWPAPYQVNLLNFRVGAPLGSPQPPADPQYKPSQYDANTPASWGECFELYKTWCNAQAHTRAFDPGAWSEDRVYQTGTDYPYGSNIAAPSGAIAIEVQRACLAAAEMAGEPGAAESHDWLAARMPAVLSSYSGAGGTPAYRYAFWPE